MCTNGMGEWRITHRYLTGCYTAQLDVCVIDMGKSEDILLSKTYNYLQNNLDYGL